MDCTLQYIVKWCKKICTENIKYIPRLCNHKASANLTRSREVQQDATDHYNMYTQEALLRTVWTDGCRSWFKNSSGRVISMYAGSTLHYREIMESFRTEDFNVKNGSCNRIGFMGNGFTMREDSGGDLAFYMK